MKNGAYWKKRFKQIEESQHQQGLQCYADIEKQYLVAQRQMEAKINAWYQRFANNNAISLVEARRLLNSSELDELKWDVEQYIRYGKENAINGQWMKELENASAKVHINRLEALKLQMQQSLEVMFGNQLDSVDSTIRDVYQFGFLHTAYEIQKGIGTGWSFASPNDRLIDTVIHKPWAADGQTFSDRIWTNKQKLINELNTTLTQNIITGADPQKAINEIARKMNVSKQNTGRLIMTEQAAFSNAAQKDCFAELGVEQFEVVETLDSSTCEFCGSMDGQHFPMSQYEIGVTAPPFHPNCRGCTCPYFDDDFGVPGERAARGEDGKTYYVPGNMTYEEWKSRSNNKSTGYYSDITNKWKSKKTDSGKFEILDKYIVDGGTYIVDGKHVVSDYSEKEKIIAELLLKEFGGTVQMVPRIVYPQGKSTPDYIYDGERYDLKEPVGESKYVLYNMVAKKKTQACNFIFDITNCPLSEMEVITQIEGLYRSMHTRFIDKIILIKNQKVIGVYERK